MNPKVNAIKHRHKGTARAECDVDSELHVVTEGRNDCFVVQETRKLSGLPTLLIFSCDCVTRFNYNLQEGVDTKIGI